MRRKGSITKLGFIFTIFMISLAGISVSYSGLTDTIQIHGTVTTGTWDDQIILEGACVSIIKTLNGSFTDPHTGEDLTETTDLIAIAAAFPTKFNMTICVRNCGTEKLTDVVVYDTIKNTVAPRQWTADKGTVQWINHDNNWDGIHFGFNDLTWTIGDLGSGELVCLQIRIETLQNPDDKYVPTSGDEGDNQYIGFNDGATVNAISPCGPLSATTDGINEDTGLILIINDEVPGNNIGKICTELPCSTHWAEDICHP